MSAKGRIVMESLSANQTLVLPESWCSEHGIEFDSLRDGSVYVLKRDGTTWRLVELVERP